MEFDMTDVTDRRMEADGFAASHVCDNSAGSNALVRREPDGKIGWARTRTGVSGCTLSVVLLRSRPPDAADEPQATKGEGP